MHTTGGYSVQTYLTSKLIFDLKPDDVYWCTADVGWVTGHSYVVYGILQNGVTTVMYEGAPNFPEADRLWKIVDDHKVTVFYTAPTAIRACIKWGDQYPSAAFAGQSAPAGHSGRTHQSRGLDVVSRDDRQGKVPDCRHLVADRNRRHYAGAPARRGSHQAWFGNAPVFRH